MNTEKQKAPEKVVKKTAKKTVKKTVAKKAMPQKEAQKKKEVSPKAAASKAAPQSALDAAVTILKHEKGPLDTKAIMERMLKRGLWKTNGKTPHATLYSAIAREIKLKGERARFVKVDRGTFAAR